MNLTSLLLDLYRRTKFATSPDATVTTRLTAFLNEAQREILTLKQMGALRFNTLQFTSVAGTPFVALPQAIERIVTIQDRTVMVVLQEMSIQDIRFTDPGLTASSANPYGYAVLDYAAAVAQDPSAAAQLWVKSDSAADGATKTAYIEGVVTGGYYQKASVALNGTTAAQVGSLASWIAITKFYIALTAGGQTTATGNVTLTQTSGAGTELARLPPGADYARYVRLHLYPTPSLALTYTADVELHIEDMVNGGDEPYLPEDFHWLLVSMAIEKEYIYRERLDLAGPEMARARNGIADLQVYLARQSGVAANAQRRRRYSQLGGWFPAGT